MREHLSGVYSLSLPHAPIVLETNLESACDNGNADPPLSLSPSVIERANFLFPSLVIRFCLATGIARERDGQIEREQNMQQKKL